LIVELDDAWVFSGNAARVHLARLAETLSFWHDERCSHAA